MTNMGMPEVVISFKEAAQTLVSRSSRGIVAVLVNDDTAEGQITKVRARDDLSGLFDEENAAFIKLALSSGASTVLAVRITTNLTGALGLLKNHIFNWLAYPDAEAGDTSVIVTWIKEQRATGKTFKAVVYNATTPNSEGIVNFTTAEVTTAQPGSQEATVYTGAQYCAAIAGIIAGTPLTQSITYFALDDVVDATQSTDPDADVDAGKLIVVFDGEVYKLGRGVTSLTNPQYGVSKAFKKIKHIDGADLIADDIRYRYEHEYVGKVPNSYDNKQVFIAAVGDYFLSLTGSVLDPGYENAVALDPVAIRKYLESLGIDTSELEDEAVVSEPTDSSVFLAARIKFLDAMEDLVLSIGIN